MYDADKPIKNSSQDRLNRTTFANYLAHSLCDHKNTDSLVVGLFGDFGVGKTSLINLIIEEINLASAYIEPDEKPIILNFSPWSYSGLNSLLYNFFRRLSSVLRDAPDLPHSSRIIYLLELYISFFTGKAIPNAFRKKRNWLQKLHLKESDSPVGWESGRDLTQIKAELNELLGQQKHKIIIFIDNIARLYDEEIKQIFQIVKSIGDYSNTVYVLALNKTQIYQAMERIEQGCGENFIEKVIQLPFEIPPIQAQDLEKIFISRMQTVIQLVPPEGFQADEWADIYYDSLRYFFKNCRDITRYINTLNFSYERLREVVNAVDFFALTAIQVFLPEIYTAIRDNKDLFTDLFDQTYTFNADLIAKDKKRCEEIFSRNITFPRHTLLTLLMTLFPRLRYIYEPDFIFYHSNSIARKMLRICSPDLFDAYFRLTLQGVEMTQAEFETILIMSHDQEAFDHALARLNQDNRILTFLDLLDHHILRQIPEEHIPAVINALLDNGDLFPQGEKTLLSSDTQTKLYRIIHTLLKRYSNHEERFNILQEAISTSTKSIYSLVSLIKEGSREHRTNPDNFMPLEYRDLSPEELVSLRELTASRIAYWANMQHLIDHPQLLLILQAWLQWDEESAQRYVAEVTQQDKGLLSFLRATLYEPLRLAMKDNRHDSDHELALANITPFINPHALTQHAKLIFENNYFEKLSEENQVVLMIFLEITHTETTKVIPKTTP